MEKILYLYNNSQICKDMGNSAMKRVREEFTLNAYAERMISSLKKCV
jgi:glycosyltransferase involved in cell wall biosynthesis